MDLDAWRHLLEQGVIDVGPWRYMGEGGRAPPTIAELFASAPARLLPLVRERSDHADPITDRVRVEREDVVYFAWPYADGERAGSWLRRNGWGPHTGPA